MSNIFDGESDSDVEIKTNNAYAKNYNNWRKKEELNKLKTKYGEDALYYDDSSSSSSSEDDDENIELNESLEKDFFKTLSCLKNKDPSIYDKNTVFFHDTDDVKPPNKSKKEKPMYINDYERKLILEKGGKLSDDEENYEDLRAHSPTYVEEQNQLKNNLKKALEDVKDDEEDEWGGMFKTRQKTKEEKDKEEKEYKLWLAGQQKELKDKNMEKELKPLKDYWNNPKLDEGEKFLRDYILGKKFLDKEDDDYIPTYDEIVHDSDEDLSNDEEAVKKQEEFEHKYNFRFEEPDQEFIKRYPRTMENSVRKTDDRRKIKRAETKERKQKEKQEKMKELKKMQEFKRKEIEEKIEKLKEITGNTDIGFKDDDIDGDFDPEAHDKRMQSLFNDEFYQQEEGDQKPEFPEIDEELEIENWEKYEDEIEPTEGPHCEDEDFNMDADYDPNAHQEVKESVKNRRKRKRKSKFAEVISQSKPVFDPNDKTYEKYLDEYYKLDCEDIIGDLPCRFKYRKVEPNNFGLTIEEILMAKDRELNRWCSIKKVVQHRQEHVEKNERMIYGKKAQNINLKKKTLPSLFEPEEENETNNTVENSKIKNKKEEEINSNDTLKEKHEKTKKAVNDVSSEANKSNKNAKEINNMNNNSNKKKKNKNKEDLVNQSSKDSNNRKRKLSIKTKNIKNKKFKQNDSNSDLSNARLSAYGINPKKYRNKLKYGKK